MEQPMNKEQAARLMSIFDLGTRLFCRRRKTAVSLDSVGLHEVYGCLPVELGLFQPGGTSLKEQFEAVWPQIFGHEYTNDQFKAIDHAFDRLTFALFNAVEKLNLDAYFVKKKDLNPPVNLLQLYFKQRIQEERQKGNLP